MTTPTLRRLLAASCLAAACQRAPAAPGLVVESVDRGGRGAGAGLREADELLAWQAGGAGGPLRSPFDLLAVDIEHSPRGPLTITGRREGKAHTWTLQPGAIKVSARPSLPDGDPV